MAISGRYCRSERAIVKTVRTSDLSLRGGRRPTWQSREGTPDPYWPPLKRCWPPDLSLRGGRRPTWQSWEGTPDPHRPPLKQCWPPRLVIARRPEADVAISQYSLG